MVDGHRVHVGNLGVDGEILDRTASVLSRAALDGAVVAWVRVDGDLVGAILLADLLRPRRPTHPAPVAGRGYQPPGHAHR